MLKKIPHDSAELASFTTPRTRTWNPLLRRQMPYPLGQCGPASHDAELCRLRELREFFSALSDTLEPALLQGFNSPEQSRVAIIAVPQAF